MLVASRLLSFGSTVVFAASFVIILYQLFTFGFGEYSSLNSLITELSFLLLPHLGLIGASAWAGWRVTRDPVRSSCIQLGLVLCGFAVGLYNGTLFIPNKFCPTYCFNFDDRMVPELWGFILLIIAAYLALVSQVMLRWLLLVAGVPALIVLPYPTGPLAELFEPGPAVASTTIRDYDPNLELVGWSVDSKYLLATSGHSVRAWDEKGQVRRYFSTPSAEGYGVPALSEVKWSSTAKYISVVQASGNITIWGWSDDYYNPDLPKADNKVASVVWSADDKRFALLSGNCELQIWDIGSKKASLSRPAQCGAQAVSWSPARNLVAFLGMDGSPVIWDLSTNATISLNTTTPTSGSAILAWSPDGTKLAVLPKSPGSLTLYSDRGELLKTISDKPYTSLVWSPNSQMLALASTNDEISLYTTDGSVTAHFAAKNSSQAVVWSPDSKKVAISTPARSGQGWEGSVVITIAGVEGQIRQEYKNAHKSEQASFAWSPDGKWLASAGGSTIHLWQVAQL